MKKSSAIKWKVIVFLMCASVWSCFDGVEINHNDGCSTCVCVQEETRRSETDSCAQFGERKTVFSEKTFFVLFFPVVCNFLIMRRSSHHHHESSHQQQDGTTTTTTPPKKNNNLGASQYNAVFETNKRSSPKSLDREIVNIIKKIVMRINFKKNWFLKILLYHFWGLILARGRQTKNKSYFGTIFPMKLASGMDSS